MTVQRDGAILLGGYLSDPDGYPARDFGRAVLVRLRGDGTLDDAFGTAGVASARAGTNWS